MRKRLIFVYYFVLILSLALYTNMNQSPNVVIRLGYLIALVFPVINRVNFYPPLIVCTLGLSKSTFAYPLMPTDMIYYILISLLFCFVSLYHRKFKTRLSPSFVLVLLYITLNDLCLQGELSQMTIVLFIYILFFICIEDKTDATIKLLPLAFAIISFVISTWVLFYPGAQINNYHTVGGLAQGKGWTDPNYLSATIGMGLIIALQELLSGGKKFLYSAFLVSTVVLSSFSILQLASRGVFLTVVVSLVSLTLLSNAKIGVKILFTTIAVFFIVFLYSNAYFDFILARLEKDDGTGEQRTTIWISKIQDFFHLDNPVNLLFGVGQSEGMKLGKYLGNATDVVSTHNDFLSFLIYYGYVGVLIIFYVFTYPIRICTPAIRSRIIPIIVYLILCSMTIEPMARGSFVYWGVIFYIIVLARHSRIMGTATISGDENKD